MDKDDLDAFKAAQKAALDLAARNMLFCWTWPFVVYSAVVLAFPRKQ